MKKEYFQGNYEQRDFPGGLLVGTLTSTAGGFAFHPWSRAQSSPLKTANKKTETILHQIQ